MVTHIGDRESDLYEAWARIGDGRREHLLVRSSQERRLLGQADIPQVAATHRVINLNYSIHGVLKQINAI